MVQGVPGLAPRPSPNAPCCSNATHYVFTLAAMQAEAHEPAPYILKDDDNSELRCRGCRGGSCSATDGKDSFGEFLKKSHPDYTGRRTGLEHCVSEVR